MASTSYRRRGFTLIELLTVIAIIGILAAIIIPVVGKVRQTAQGTRNVSNVRQLTVANLLYEQDYRHFASGNDWTSPDAGTRSWHQRVARYVGVNQNAFQQGETPPGVFWRPDGGLDAYGREQIVQINDSGTYSAYGRNNTIYVNDSSVSSGNSIKSLRQIRNPAQLYLISDWNHWDTYGANNTATFPGYFGGKYTFGFADAHVKTYTAGTMPPANPGAPGANRAFWDARVQ